MIVRRLFVFFLGFSLLATLSTHAVDIPADHLASSPDVLQKYLNKSVRGSLPWPARVEESNALPEKLLRTFPFDKHAFFQSGPACYLILSNDKHQRAIEAITTGRICEFTGTLKLLSFYRTNAVGERTLEQRFYIEIRNIRPAYTISPPEAPFPSPDDYKQMAPKAIANLRSPDKHTRVTFQLPYRGVAPLDETDATAMGLDGKNWTLLQHGAGEALILLHGKTQYAGVAFSSLKNDQRLLFYGRTDLGYIRGRESAVIVAERVTLPPAQDEKPQAAETNPATPKPTLREPVALVVDNYKPLRKLLLRALIGIYAGRRIQISLIYRGTQAPSRTVTRNFPQYTADSSLELITRDNYLDPDPKARNPVAGIHIIVPQKIGDLANKLQELEPGDTVHVRCRVEDASRRNHHFLIVEDLVRPPLPQD